MCDLVVLDVVPAHVPERSAGLGEEPVVTRVGVPEGVRESSDLYYD